MTENNNNGPNLNQWIKVNSKKKNNSNKKVARNNLDIKSLENWLWEAACKIRGEIDAPKYKDYILPLIFMKRLSDVFEDELNKLSEEYKQSEIVEELLKEDHSLVRFYLPKGARWNEISKKTTNVGEFLTDCVLIIAKENQKLQGVIDIVDFNATTVGQRIISDEKLILLIDIMGRYRLGLDDVEPDIFGRAYEYLLRKFAEVSVQSAGEFYTPREVSILISRIVEPKPGQEIYDPCCGSGGLLIKTYLRFKENFKDNTNIKPISLFGQEISHTTYALAKMNSFIHDMEANVVLGDTMNKPAFINSDGSLKEFDLVIANPMWNQDFSQDIYERDPYNRFNFGFPPSSSADWGWIQHMFNSLKDNGRMAVVLDTGSLTRGSSSITKNRERYIRKQFIEADFIESIVLLPENMFYNTNAPGIILIINKKKKNKDKILFIDASNFYEKEFSKNHIPEEKIAQISEIFHTFKEFKGISKIISNKTIKKNNFNIIPSRYVIQKDLEDEIMPIEDAIILLLETEEEKEKIDIKLKNKLRELGFLK